MERNQDIYRVILGNKGSTEMLHRVHKYMVAETLRDMANFQLYSDLNLPPEIAAQLVIGALLSLATWWLETPNDYTAQQLAALLYQTLHHRQPPES